MYKHPFDEEKSFMSTSQKDAVVAAVAKILGKSFVPGATNVKDSLTEDQLTELRESIFKGIKSGDITFNKEMTDDKALRRYVNGMIDNHLRKAKELNGGQKYSTKSTGGSRDSQIAVLKKLAKNYEAGTPEHSKVVSAINMRESTLAAERQRAASEKKKASALKNVDTSILPPELSQILNDE